MEFQIVNEQLPVITINFEEMKRALTETMEKYKGYIVTEDNLSLCKATQKELAGIRIKTDNYRKEKKKELSKPIEAFEDQCKILVRLIEEAEKPIKEGIQVFDDKKREDKKQTAILLIKHSISKHLLNDKYAIQLTVLDKYMNLTASAKDVADDIEQRAVLLEAQQTTERDMLEIIKDTIETVNKNINAKISLADFQRLIISGTSTKEIIQEIHARAERIKKSEIEAEELRVKKAEEEAERIRFASLTKETEPVVPTTEESKLEVAAVQEEMPLLKVEEPLYFVELRVTGTLSHIKNISAILKTNEIEYTVIKKGPID